jgi:hypothetical protein
VLSEAGKTSPASLPAPIITQNYNNITIIANKIEARHRKRTK